MQKACKKMCNKCPWRNTAPAGWLGEASPQDFVDLIKSEVKLPCHSVVDYSDENWEEAANSDEVPHCAGSLQAMKKLFKLPRDREYSDLVNNAIKEEYHMHPEEFIEHHDDSLIWES